MLKPGHQLFHLRSEQSHIGREQMAVFLVVKEV
jgi:hypothetical protein